MTMFDDLLGDNREEFARKVSEMAGKYAGARPGTPPPAPFGWKKCDSRKELGDWFMRFAQECRALRPEAA